MKQLLFILLLLLPPLIKAQVVLNESKLNTSITNIAEIAEDADKKIDVDQLLNSDELTFEKLQKPIRTINKGLLE